eukprot:SAG11_NODE_20308_length_448_cov_1.131805_1_plen_100_part_01
MRGSVGVCVVRCVSVLSCACRFVACMSVACLTIDWVPCCDFAAAPNQAAAQSVAAVAIPRWRVAFGLLLLVYDDVIISIIMVDGMCHECPKFTFLRAVLS